MAATAIVQAWLEPEVKEEVRRILAEIGLTPTAAVRLLFKRVVAEKRFPMELRVPNERRSPRCESKTCRRSIPSTTW
jgi:addiction module RelB/DinJ family antitoxin